MGKARKRASEMHAAPAETKATSEHEVPIQEEVDEMLKSVSEDDVREMIKMVDDYAEKYSGEATKDGETPASDFLTPEEVAALAQR